MHLTEIAKAAQEGNDRLELTNEMIEAGAEVLRRELLPGLCVNLSDQRIAQIVLTLYTAVRLRERPHTDAQSRR